MGIAFRGKPSTRLIVKPLGLFFCLFLKSRKEVLLCVIFKVRQSANTVPAVRIVQIICRCASLSSDMAAMQLANVILIFAVFVLAIQSVRKCGERRWKFEADEF